MSLPQQHARYSLADYVAVEDFSNIKHEYLEGEILAMAGGTLEHSRLASRVGAMLSRLLAGRPCNVFSSDARIRIAAADVVTYPDVSVVCGRPETDAVDTHAVLNPTVLVEVTSKRTEAYDRGEKLRFYQQIDSLREVIIVSHREPRIDVWQRTAEGTWATRAFGAGQQAAVPSLAGVLDVDEVYYDPAAAAEPTQAP